MNEPRSRLPVFAVGERSWSISDVISYARFAGIAAPRFGVANAHQPGADTDDVDAKVDQAIIDFRYQHDLISAEECDAWLALRGLRYVDLHQSLSRRCRDNSVVDDDAAEVDFLLGDRWPIAARNLAWRVALACEQQLPLGAENSSPAAIWGHWQSRFEAARSQLLAPDARLRALARQRRQLTRFEFVLAEFDSLDAAQEARSCVNEDQALLADVAAENGYPFRTECRFVEDLPSDWALAMGAGVLNRACAPIFMAGPSVLLLPLRRIEPSLEDGEVTARIDAAMVEQHFDGLASQHLRWIIT